jgi:hypothetical protein
MTMHQKLNVPKQQIWKKIKFDHSLSFNLFSPNLIIHLHFNQLEHIFYIVQIN